MKIMALIGVCVVTALIVAGGYYVIKTYLDNVTGETNRKDSDYE
jgi:hypothetical protein